MKLTLTDVKSGYNLTPLNTNFEAIEQELQNKVLYRNNPAGEPNQMEGSLDMNSYDVQNVRALDVQTFTIQGTDSTQFLDASVTEAFNWAQYPEDSPVPEGTGTQFSAYHYSLKAEQSATDAETAETAAELALYNFNGTWYGSLASEPTVDPNGNAPTAGDIYLNSTNGIVYFYQGGIWNPLGGGNVTSIFGRTGAVVASAGDYTATQVTYSNTTSGLTATDTQAAIDELTSEKADNVYEEVLINTGDFSTTPFTIKISKIGRSVTAWTDTTVSHPSGTSASSAVGSIPVTYRPAGTHRTDATIFSIGVTTIVSFLSDGTLMLQYFNIADGTAATRTDSAVALSMSYGV